MAVAAWTIIDDLAGYQPIDVVETTARHLTGTRIKARHETQGVCEFIYLRLSSASVVAGDAVVIEISGTIHSAFTLTTANRGSVAISMNAMSQFGYGWFQIYGRTVAKTGANTVVSQGQVYATAAAGTLDDAVVTGALIIGAIFTSVNGTPAAQQAYIQLSYPFMSGLG